MGEAGERLARWYLEDHGLRVVATNVAFGDGEIDLLALDGGRRVAVEVRARTGGGDPVDAIDPAKRERAARLARRVGARFDVVGIRFDHYGFEVHWVPAPR